MSNLLPPNAEPQEIALDETTARISDIPVPIRSLYQPQTCPIEVLPWLAWALSVDEWDEAWTEQKKRDVVEASYDVHRIKGTPKSLKDALTAIGYENVDIIEGDVGYHNNTYVYDSTITYGADSFWPLFDVLLNIGFIPDAAAIQKIKDTISRYKNQRSVLRNLLSMDLFYDNTHVYNGANTHNGGLL